MSVPVGSNCNTSDWAHCDSGRGVDRGKAGIGKRAASKTELLHFLLHFYFLITILKKKLSRNTQTQTHGGMDRGRTGIGKRVATAPRLSCTSSTSLSHSPTHLKICSTNTKTQNHKNTKTQKHKHREQERCHSSKTQLHFLHFLITLTHSFEKTVQQT